MSYHRVVNVSYALRPVDPDPTNAEKIKAWTKDYWAALHPGLGAEVVGSKLGVTGQGSDFDLRASAGCVAGR
jgi:hypothetical protein